MKHLISMILLCFPVLIYGQGILSGTIRVFETGEQLAYVSIQNQAGKPLGLSNAYGFFSVKVDSGSMNLIYVREGYQELSVNIVTTRDTSYDVFLQQIAFETDTVSITAMQKEHSGSNSVSRVVIPVQQLKDMPVLAGEGDIMKGLQMLPGVQFGQEGTSGLFVRGGSPDQNLILLDDMPVYNVNHLFGFFSLFPPNAMKDVELIKGGFPAQYGGRLSSVIRMQTREGNMNEWKKEVSLSVISGQASIEGPLVKGKSSLFLAARKSWLDLFLRPGTAYSYRRDGIDGFTTYGFHDIIGKVNYQLSPKDRLYLSVYTGRDLGRIKTALTDEQRDRIYSSNNQIQWGNITTSMRYQRVYGSKWFGQTLLGYTRYRFKTSASAMETEKEADLPSETVNLTQSSEISDIVLKHDVDYYASTQHRLQLGVQISRKIFRPDVSLFQSRSQQALIDTSFNRRQYLSTTYAAYISHSYEPSARISLSYGIRSELFDAQGSLSPSIQPRFTARWSLDETASLKMGYSYIKQYLHLLTNSGQGLPTDLWVPATDQIVPASSHQIVLGGYKDFPSGIVSSIELYYKTMDNVIEYRDGASYYNSFDNWEEQVIQGNGRGYGGEIFVHKTRGKTNGWASYTLAWTERSFSQINEGAWFPFRYDRRHTINAFIAHKLKKEGRRVSATWMFQSGARATIPTELSHTPYDIFGELQGASENLLTLFTTNVFGEVYGYTPERNNYRMRPFHKLDVAYQMSRQKKNRKRTFTVGVYNLYGRSNPYYVFLRRSIDFRAPVQGGQLPTLTQLTEYSFLIWIPYVSWTVAF